MRPTKRNFSSSVLRYKKKTSGEGVEKREPRALLVGVRTGTVAMENSSEVPQKTKDSTTFWLSSNCASEDLKKTKTRIQKDICPTLTAMLFTIAKRWKPPECSSVDEWMKKMWYITQWTITQPWKKKEERIFTEKNFMKQMHNYGNSLRCFKVKSQREKKRKK